MAIGTYPPFARPYRPPEDKTAEDVIYASIIVLFALGFGWLVRTIVLMAVRKFVMLRHSDLGTELVQHRVLIHCSHIIPPLVILALLPFAFTSDSLLRTVVFRALLVYTTIVICRAICSVTAFIWLRFDETRNSKNLPLKGILDTP